MESKNKTKKLIEILIKKKIKICSAESVTGGRFAYEIIKHENASKIFDYSLVVYSKHAKGKILKLKKQLDKYNLVSEEIAESMVKAAIQFSESKKTLGISCTGQAGPGYLNKRNEIGTVFIGISFEQKLFTIKKKINFNSRSKIIDAIVEEMIDQSLIIVS